MAALPALVAFTVFQASVPASAYLPTTGNYTCSAVGVWYQRTPLGTAANQQNDPCLEDHVVPPVTVENPVQNVRADAVNAETQLLEVLNNDEDLYARSDARIDGAGYCVDGSIGCVVRFGVRNAVAFASARCGFDHGLELRSSSRIAGFEIETILAGPLELELNQPIDLKLGKETFLHLNWEMKTASEVIRRAVWLERPNKGLENDIIFAEARAGINGSCT